ncbi:MULTISPECIES: cytochrome P450 [Pseudomonadota]|jgi:cytochrome P450|uniref:cytochrome P450 n=2 Tax=Pseudomonadota TaxID=1224 RepID=UPI000769DF85|nr:MULTISPECIES: cytochrome P450 [Pseudomonadota]MAF62375.1 cytochrome P450 [Blastomonas sp.]MBA4779694.1 cytochrome P450 [Blastomonas sp.]|tara:strand:+ start:67041 stop:68279 length:1239 start_codon:yes stop_codon:yes gene_type:complete
MTVAAEQKSFFHPEVLTSPFAFYQEHLATEPVYHDKATGLYLVLSHRLVSEATSRTDEFSNNFQAVLSGARSEDPEVKAILDEGWPQVDTLLTADPPVHTRFRKLVNLAFSAPRVNKLEAHIREIARDLIDRMLAKDEIEFVRDFAMPLPIRMISEQLGLTHVPPETIKRWTDAFVDRLGGMVPKERELQCAREVVEFQHAIKAQMDQRRASPTDDLLSDLVHAEIDGERPLDDGELLSIVQQLLVAGNETTTATLAEGIILLARNPSELAKAKADPKIIPNMIEEMLRLASASSGIWRVMKADAELGGVTLPKGAMVMMRYAAANRDPERYDEPDRFLADRANARTHLAFGRGIHMCVGNMLSRKEMTVAFEELLPRISGITLTDEAAIAYPPNMMLRGPVSVPVRFEPRA